LSSKTKIVVLRMKELIYTGIFVALGILLILLLVFMFAPKGAKTDTTDTSDQYIPGVYTSSIMLNGNAVDIAVTVDKNSISSIQMVNVNEMVATMYPLMEPAVENLAEQIISSQSLENITYPDENQYTSIIILDAVSRALDKAAIPETDQETDEEKGTQPETTSKPQE
jgi:uncharacterized protein with FMN-binding domain